MRPSGFTPITTDYTPISPAPPISSLEPGSPEPIRNQVAIFSEVKSSSSVSGSINSRSSFSITASADKTYIRAGETLTINAVVSGILSKKSIMSLRLIRSSENSIEGLPGSSIESEVNERGVVIFKLKIGSELTEGLKLRFVVTPKDTSSSYSLQVEASALPQTYSNIISVTIIAPSQSATPSEVPTPEGVPIIPIHDVVVTTSTYIFKTYVLDQEIDLAPTNPNPRGSSGEGIYQDLNIISPRSTGGHTKSPLQALQRLLGSSLDELERVNSWVSEILTKVHSATSGSEDSEVDILKSILRSTPIGQAVGRLEALVEEAGMYAADTADTYLSDYSNGNTVVNSNAVEQHNVGQMRVQTSSTYTVNSPTISQSSQQAITQTRFEHHAGDMYQASHIHYWLRAEDQYTCIARTAARYNQVDLAEYSANATYASGNTVHYADKEWNQVGQFGPPLHPLNSNSAIGYGDSIKLVQGDLKTRSITGSIIDNAAREIYIQAGSSLSMLGATFNAQATSGPANIHSSEGANIRGESRSSISSSGVTSIDGTVVFINGGKSNGAVVSNPTPRIIKETPKTFEPMKDVAEYPRDTPISPGPRGVVGNRTPEPGSTPIDTSVGGWLTKHLG